MQKQHPLNGRPSNNPVEMEEDLRNRVDSSPHHASISYLKKS